MNIGAFFASLGAALLARLSSVGAALAAGFSTIIMSWTGDQRGIALDVKEKFATSYQARKTAGASEIDSIEGAATDAFNTFCSDEKKEFVQEAGAIITLLESSAKSAAGIIGSTISGGAPAAAGVIDAAVGAVDGAIDAGAGAAEKALGG